MVQPESPQPRYDQECAFIGDDLHLFGGRKGDRSYYFPRNEIWTFDVKEEKKWFRNFAQGKNIPPPCEGARCVVINGIMYSYGGEKENGGYLGEVFGLVPKKMKWIQVGAPIKGKKPWQRLYCCLWAIGVRLIMFGGRSEDIIRRGRLQSGAQSNGYVNNEIYEFVFEEGSEKGFWLDVELSGERPQPRQRAAMETIDEHRGLLHGGTDFSNSFNDAFVIDLREKKWISVDFLPKPSARSRHKICRLSKTGFKDRYCFFLVGGYNPSIGFSDHAYILDFEKRKSYAFHLNQEVAPIVYCETLHCVESRDGSAHIIVTQGEPWTKRPKEILFEFFLGPSNESYMQIETQILPSANLISTVPHNELLSIRELERELEQMRMEVEKLRDERAQSHQVIEGQRRQFEEERVQKTRLEARNQSLEEERSRLVETKLEERTQSLEEDKLRLSEQRSGFETRCDSLRTKNSDLERDKKDATHTSEAQKTKLKIQSRDLQKEIVHLKEDLQTTKIELEAVRESHRRLIDYLATNHVLYRVAALVQTLSRTPV